MGGRGLSATAGWVGLGWVGGRGWGWGWLGRVGVGGWVGCQQPRCILQRAPVKQKSVQAPQILKGL